MILRTVEEVERIARFTSEFMQVRIARAKRIERVRESLASLDDDERFAIACELLGMSEDELWEMVNRGTEPEVADQATERGKR